MEEARGDAGLRSDAEQVRRLNEAVGRSDFETVSELLDPDVVWEHNIGGGSPEEGVYNGRDSVLGLFERILEAWESLRAEPHEIRELGDGVYLVRGELHGKHSASATEVVSPYELQLEIRDRLLVKGRMATGDNRAFR